MDLCSTYIRIRGGGNGCRCPQQAVNLAALAPGVKRDCSCIPLPRVDLIGLNNLAGTSLVNTSNSLIWVQRTYVFLPERRRTEPAQLYPIGSIIDSVSFKSMHIL